MPSASPWKRFHCNQCGKATKTSHGLEQHMICTYTLYARKFGLIVLKTFDTRNSEVGVPNDFDSQREVWSEIEVIWHPLNSWFWAQHARPPWEGYPRSHLRMGGFEVWGKNLEFWTTPGEGRFEVKERPKLQVFSRDSDLRNSSVSPSVRLFVIKLSK